MKICFVLLMLMLLTNFQCRKDSLEGLPLCIRQKIQRIKLEPVWNPPATVHEYEYNGRTVYGFSSNCCDQYNVVVDEHCNYICAPSGGFTGKGDGKCADFAEKAKLVRLVWKDER